jgi:hypothetical protein
MASWDFPSDHEAIKKFYDMEVVQHFTARTWQELQVVMLDLHFILDGLVEDVREYEQWVRFNLPDALELYFDHYGKAKD